MTWRRLMIALVPVMALAACSGGQAASTGVLQGHLYGVGGYENGLRPLPGTVTLNGPAGQRDVAVGADGAYSVEVTAGTYGVEGHSPLYGGGTYLCRASTAAQVATGKTTTTDTYCHMR